MQAAVNTLNRNKIQLALGKQNKKSFWLDKMGCNKDETYSLVSVRTLQPLLAKGFQRSYCGKGEMLCNQQVFDNSCRTKVLMRGSIGM